MIETAIQHEILFFDDFLHQTVDRVQWDHIKFNHPVFLEQIRIIPKDCYISLKNGTNRFGRTCPKNFRLEFYANNLNKKEEERATLVKIGSLLYNDDDQHVSNDLSNFIVKPQSIPLDWLVIVGSYLSLSVALIGVKAKQSSTPTQTPTLNNNVNNLKLINQSSFNMAHPSQSGFIINQSKPNMSSSQSMPLINTNMEANGAFAIRPNNPSLIQPQANMLNHPPPNHNMSSLLPTPLLTIPPSGMNHHHQQTQNQQQNDFHHQAFMNQSNFQQNSNMRPPNDQIRFQLNQPPLNSTTSIQYQIPHQSNSTIRPLLQQPQQQRNQKVNNMQQQQSLTSSQTVSSQQQQQKNFIPRTNQYQYRNPANTTNTQMIQPQQHVPLNTNTTNLTNRISPSKVTKPSESSGPLLPQPPELLSIESGINNQNEKASTVVSQTINNNMSPTSSVQDNQTSQQNDRLVQEEASSTDNELNMIETNLTFYLDSNDEVDELELVKQSRTLTDLKLNSNLNEFLLDQLNQIDIETLDLSEIKNPIWTKYEQLLREGFKFEMNLNEKKIHDYLIQNEMFKEFFDERQAIDLTNEKIWNLIESLVLNLSKSLNLFHNLFVLNNERLIRLNELVIQILNVNYCTRSITNNKREWLFRIKNVKLGFKLASLLLTKYDMQTFKSLIDLDLQSNLIDLLEIGILNSKSCHLMSIPMMLKCLNTLNWTIQFKHGAERFILLKSRLSNLFLDFKETTNKSRLILAFTQILINLKFYDLMSQFERKCQEKFIKKQSNNKFDQEMTYLIENIYIHCIRNLKLNKKQFLNETIHRGSGSTTSSMAEQVDLDAAKTNIKKMKTNEYPDDLLDEYYFCDEFENDFNKIPLQNLFDKFPSESTPYPAHNLLLRWFDSFDTLKYILMLKSYIYDKSKSNSKQLLFLNSLIEKLFNDLLNPSETNGNSFIGIEYLLNNLKLTKCIFKIILKNETESCVEKLDLASKTLALSSSLMFNLNKILTRTNDAHLETYLLNSVDKFQQLALIINNTNLAGVFASPDGNMSNKYVYCLLNWFELMLVDKHLNESNTNKELNSFRSYILNSLTEIFYILCKTNSNWNMPHLVEDSSSLILVLDNEFYLNDYRLCLKRLNQYVSLLVNSFSSLRVKLFQESLNRDSIEKLVYKLKVIKSCIEPIYIAMTLTSDKSTDNKLALSIANMSSYYNKIQCLNQFIDFFRRTIDKNLSMFFLKQYFTSLTSDTTNKKRIVCDYLYSNITILNILHNLTQSKSLDINLFDMFSSNASDNEFNSKLHVAHLDLVKYGLNLNENFNAKRYLGHLISRNFLHVCIHLINRSSDYLIFYSKKSSNSTFTSLNLNHEQMDLFLRLINTTIQLMRTILSKLIKVRNENFTDFSALPILFRFYGIFNYCLQSSISKLKQNKQIIQSYYESISKNLNDIFLSYTQPILSLDDKTVIKSTLFTNLFRELAKYTSEKPFNFYYGLQLFTQLLPLPLPIPITSHIEAENREEDIIMLNERRLLSDHLEPLFLDEKFKQIDLFEINEKTPSSLKNMLRVLSICSVDSQISYLLKRVVIQMSDLSERMCSILLKCLLDYAIELLAVIRDEKEVDENGFNEEDRVKNGELDLDTNEEIKQETSSQTNAEIKAENDRIDGLINEICESHYQINNLNGKLKESEMDTLYDTEIMLEDTNFHQSKIVTPVEVISLNKEEIISEPIQPAKEVNAELDELKEKYKLSLLKNFSNLIKFICGLLETERPGCGINSIRIEFINLITSTKSKIKMNYMKFICNCIKYCNQLDLITKIGQENQEDLIKSKDLIQECLFKFIETLIRHTPDLLIRNFKLKMFCYEEAMLTNESNEEDQILDLVQKCLLDHLSTSKLESIRLSSSVLTSLILLSQLFKVYLVKLKQEHLINQNETILINPILKQYLMDNTYSLSSFIRELDKSFCHDSIEFVNLLEKFFIHISLLLENLVTTNKRVNGQMSRRLRDLFEWHNSKFNIGLEIDKIPISNTLKNKPNNENSLDNLLILIANVERTADLDLNEKLEFCSNQTKRVVNILNDVNISHQDTKLEVKFHFNISPNLINMSKEDFHDYFMKRQVFSNKFTQDDFRKYELEWIDNSLVKRINESELYDDLIQIDLDDDIKKLFKSDLEFNSAIILDGNFNKQLNNSLDQTYLEELFCENVDLLVENKLEKQENSIDTDSSTTKNKNVDMIRFFNESYRRYKAPMRGGHSNPVSRHLVTPTTNTISNLVSNSSIIAPPNLVNNLNNLLSPSPMILNATSQMSRHDSFRARAPNTSRPASLHVDEYYRLQNASKQQNHVK